MGWNRLALILAALWPLGATAGDVDYLRDVKPILARRCVSCHGVLKQKSGLRLDTAVRIFQGGNAGTVVEPGNCDESPLVDAITGRSGVRMPPEGEGEALSAQDIDVINRWVAAGAKTPATEPETPDPRSHWAFRLPVRPALTQVKNPAWAMNPVDTILSEVHESRGLIPVAPAEKSVLLRRIYLDLTGIAPTPAEIQGFIDDSSEDAYEKVVDRLLNSPRYGERWGRHWMDVWRYSDWDGFGAEVRESQPHVWRWRDWIVESLNSDKGYDRMVVEMLAADEASPGDESALRATGYLARNWYKFSRNVWLDNTIEHTSKAFLGLTTNCARCHDHKYDPIAQRDYYRMRAVFEPLDIRTDRVPGQPDTSKNGLSSVYDSKADAPTFLFVRGNEKEPDTSKMLSPAVPAIFGVKDFDKSIKPVALPAAATRPGLRPFVKDETLAAARAEVAKRTADLAKAAKGTPAVALGEKGLAAAKTALTAAEARVAADEAKFQARADADLLGRLAAMAERQAAVLSAEVALIQAEASKDGKAKAADVAAKKKALESATAALAKADGAYTPLGPVYPSTSTGRRLALAKWIASRQNPLTARVAVNHVWMRHFGVPLVPTVADFGNNGKPPTNSALLDWLAVDFMESGWSFKALHRGIVTSRAYRMKSTGEDASAGNLAADPGNVSLWRQNPRRIEAEAVRDNVLAAAGTLDPTMGGPDIDPAGGETVTRRSLYFRHAKEKRVTFLKLFDSPSVVSCYRRAESVVPQQALALVNSPLALEQAKVLAKTLTKEASDDARFVDAAFLRMLGRRPTPPERSECLGYLTEQGRKLSQEGPEKPSDRARADLVHVLFNHNDFVTIR